MIIYCEKAAWTTQFSPSNPFNFPFFFLTNILCLLMLLTLSFTLGRRVKYCMIAIFFCAIPIFQAHDMIIFVCTQEDCREETRRAY